MKTKIIGSKKFKKKGNNKRIQGNFQDKAIYKIKILFLNAKVRKI